MSQKRLNNQGFTLVELLIVCPVLMICIAILMNFMFNQYGNLLIQNTAVNLQVQASNIISSIRNEAKNSESFVSQTNDYLTDDFAPSGGWSESDKSKTLIISRPAFSAKPGSPQSQPVVIKGDVCNPNDKFNYNVILFSEGNNLYKRIVTNTSSLNLCGSNYFKQTCPASNASLDCPEDKLLTNQLESFSVSYYDNLGQKTERPESATIVEVNIKLKDKAYAETVTAGSTMKIKRSNL